MRLRNIFRRQALPSAACPLSIDGLAAAPMTPEPDAAERAAAALLESMAGRSRKSDMPEKPKEKGPRYYKALSKRIAVAHAAEERAATRYVAYCEQQLAVTPPKGGLGGLEVGLYRHLDTVEREGGDLKRRWQHCLADVTVRMMSKN